MLSAVIWAALTHPIEFLRGMRDGFRSEVRSNRTKNHNRNALALHFGMTREELDDLFEGMK